MILQSAESVGRGHPDKVCDQISDAILDAMLFRDPESRVAVEVLLTGNLCVVAGEVRGPQVNFKTIAEDVLASVGYHAHVQVAVQQQSATISHGADLGAGDQGIVYGYACDETPALMPAPIWYANRCVEALTWLQGPDAMGLGFDCKVQLSLEYFKALPIGLHTAIFSQVHEAEVDPDWVREQCRQVLERVLPQGWLHGGTRVLVNHSGPWILGGPQADTGLTGRKIIVDTYGGAAPHGGGAFSGKDSTKVDRSGAYMARYVAKNIVQAGWARRCLVQVGYVIGAKDPVVVNIDTMGTGTVAERWLADDIRRARLFRTSDVQERLNLKAPIYRQTAVGGHFGRPQFTWEACNPEFGAELANARTS